MGIVWSDVHGVRVAQAKDRSIDPGNDLFSKSKSKFFLSVKVS